MMAVLPILLVCSFIILPPVIGQPCNSKDFGVAYNGNTIFSVSSVNNTCLCDNFASSGQVVFQNANVTSLTVGTLTASSGGIQVPAGVLIDLGYGAPGRQADAGKIGYGTPVSSSSLNIAGKGTAAGARRVRLVDIAEVGDLVTVGGSYDCTGLRGFYYSNMQLREPYACTSVDATLVMAYGGGGACGACNGGIQCTSFSTRWSGYVLAAYTGTVTLSAMADDGVRVWWNNNNTPVIDAWQVQNTTTYSAAVDMVQGTYYPFRVEYFQSVASYFLMVQWSWPGQATTTVPAANLCTASGVRVVAGTSTFDGQVTFNGPAFFSSGIGSPGAVSTVNGPLAVSGAATVLSGLGVIGGASLDSLTVSGRSTFTGAVNVGAAGVTGNGNVGVAGTLNVLGQASLAAGAAVAGGVSVTSGTTSLQATTVAGGFSVTSGSTNLAGGATVANGLSVTSGTTSLAAGATVAGGLSVTSGSTSLAAGATVAGGLSVTSGTTSVGAVTSGNVAITGSLSVSTTSTFTGTATFNGASTFAAVQQVTMNGSVAINGGASFLAGTVVDFGAGASGRQSDAGKIGYGILSSGASLDIVGAGTTVGSRTVRLFDNLIVNNAAQVSGLATFSGGATFSSVVPTFPVGMSIGAAGITFADGTVLKSAFYNPTAGWTTDSSLTMYLDADSQASFPSGSSVWYDLSGNGRHANLANVVQSGGAAVFGGTNSVATTQATGQTLGFGAAHTVEFVVRFTSLCTACSNTDTPMMCTAGTTTTNSNYMHLVVRGTNFFMGYYNDDLASSASATTGTTYHVVYTDNGAGKVRAIWINGVQVASFTGAALYTGTPAMVIGNCWTSAYLNGRMYVVRTYNRQLAPAEIANNFVVAMSRFSTNNAAHWYWPVL
eukprot:TRINITY_DN4018_c0_g1_i5.p1 TRINITY_DN4018_c0_g1~~TRINITY_DN4018_c0_g1_i5.p1  ORF type:complete len:886 (-),score=210.48 TRINITY_DN4018_c0_g1_i5:226-2883(-)